MFVEDTDRFRFNRNQAVSEVFDEEVLVVNLDTGTYYSLLDSAARIWQCLVGGASLAETTQDLIAAYDGEASDIVAKTRGFVAELILENLIQAAEDAGTSVARPPQARSKQPFVPPRLERFTDMQELLLLDPVHDVEDAGWPAAKAPSES